MKTHGFSAAALVCACAFSLSSHVRAEEHISEAEAASVLDRLLRDHDAVRMHRAADAVARSLESPTGMAVDDKFPSERAQDEERVAAAVRELDEVRACGARDDGRQSKNLDRTKARARGTQRLRKGRAAGSEKLGAALKAAGVNRIVLIRHANAAPPSGNKPKKGSDGYPMHDWQRDDQMRPLTEKGKKQCTVAREWFHKDITLTANKVLVTSGAQRASQTLQLMGERHAKKKGMLSSLFCTNADVVQLSMFLLPSLHPAGIAPKCEELFDKNGYAPLAKFYAMEGGEAALAEYAEIVAGEMCGLANQVDSFPGTTLSLFGHAVFLNAVAMMLCSKVWAADAGTISKLTELDLGECEGIVIAKTNSSCTLTHKTVRPHKFWQ
jgi:hypothetical protein